jgi:tRNA(Ile)-lysidine synthase
VNALLNRIEKSILARRLFRRGESVLVAVSGGLDSMVLLDVLAQLSNAHGWRITVAHFNHQLRDRSSDADERLVGRTARKLDLPFVSGSANVRKFAAENKLSLEMAARKLRHEFLAREAGRRRIRSIVLAHHADDQVELFFLRLLRGAGGEGLAGMKWRSPSPVDGKLTLARPLLDQPKAALREYAWERRVAFREDATNAQLDFQRNRIRHELFPLLEKNYQPALSRVILRQMELIGAEADFVNEAAKEWLKGWGRQEFGKLPVALQRKCLQLQLAERGVVANFDLTEQIRETANRPVVVREGIAVSRRTDGRIEIRQIRDIGFKDGEIKVNLSGGAGEIVFEDTRIRWEGKKADSGIFRAPKQVAGCECLDADKLGSQVVLRHWRRGDRFQPLGMACPVKLQDLFTNQKIARERRHELLVGATLSGELFWVEGLRLGERFKLDKKTLRLLKWRWQRL